MNYVIATLLSVKQGQPQNNEQNHTTKTLVRFDDHFPLNYVQMCGASVPSYLKILILPVDSHTFLLLLVLRI